MSHLYLALYRDCYFYLFFFFNTTATTEIYTLSLHDALPICSAEHQDHEQDEGPMRDRPFGEIEVHHDALQSLRIDRKSTRLNSSHSQISYAVFCLKKKNKKKLQPAPLYNITPGDPAS